MSFNKITNLDTRGKGNVGMPDTPLLTTTEMQEQMDSLPNLIIEKFNDLVDALTDPEAADYIGCLDAEGDIASVQQAIDRLGDSVAMFASARHVHANKTTLDAITATLLENISALLLMFTNIDSIDVILSSSNNAIPTSQAVQNYVAGYNYKNIIKNAIYPIGAVYQTTLVSPDTIFGTEGAWQLLSTDENGVKTWKRIS